MGTQVFADILKLFYQMDTKFRGHERKRPVLTKVPEGPLLGHKGEETRLQGICDDDVKQLFEILPVTAKQTTLMS